MSDWSLEIVAAFIRAAYGKGYCDALTEESPGSLCVEHGYRMPDRRVSERDRPNEPRKRLFRAPAVALGLDFRHGSERESGTARDRALGRGRARRLPPVHVDRRRRQPVARAERARGAHRRRCSSPGLVVGPVRGDAHDGRPALQAEGHRRREHGRPSPSSTRARYPISSRSGGTSWSTVSSQKGTFVAEPGSMITKCPSKYAPKPERRLRLDVRPCLSWVAPRSSSRSVCPSTRSSPAPLPRTSGAVGSRAPRRTRSSASFVTTVVASLVLLAALLRNDFSFTYVARSTSEALPDGVHDLGVLGRAGGLARSSGCSC